MKISGDHPIIAIVGRTNVGKSTLFNRIVEKNQALVSDIENTTRDSNQAVGYWSNHNFTVVDTAGIIDVKYLSDKKLLNNPLNSIDLKTQKQVVTFFKKAAVIIFMVDNKAGIMPADRDMAKFFQKRKELKERLILVVNKVDNHRQKNEAAIFNKLGLGEPVYISAASGSATGDLLDIIVSRLPEDKEAQKPKWEGYTEEDDDSEGPQDENRPINVCIIGKPNVGKSSLLNSILGYERVIVSDIPHTTREPQKTEIIYKDKVINVIDTAGISKHGHKAERLEKYGIMKSLATLKHADIALLMLDISQDITHQDAKIIEEITDVRKSFIILANKWDLIPDRNVKKWTADIYKKLPFVTWAPIHFLSAKTGAKVDKIFDLVLAIAEARKVKLSDSQLDKFLKRIVKIHKPAKGKGIGHPHIYRITQAKVNPPRFEVRIGSHDDLHFSYARFIENQLRAQFNIVGTPIGIRIVKNIKTHSMSEERSAEVQKA
ncbi:MAG: ribosome biogenesis GTPase Der [Patescibacteria group bacterium]